MHRGFWIAAHDAIHAHSSRPRQLKPRGPGAIAELRQRPRQSYPPRFSSYGQALPPCAALKHRSSIMRFGIDRSHEPRPKTPKTFPSRLSKFKEEL
jgi:hypothetical protein